MGDRVPVVGALWSGEQILLRHPRPSDEVEFIAAVTRSRELHDGWVRPPSNPGAYRAYLAKLEQPSHIGFLVCEVTTASAVGVVNINNIVFGALCSGQLGYYAFHGHERGGRMTEALTGVVAYAFESLGLHRLEANIQPGNLASIRLVTRCGFRREGFSPQYLRMDGEWRDHERWAISAT